MEIAVDIDRREFVKLTIGATVAAALCGCAHEGGATEPSPAVAPAEAGTTIDAGAASDYEANGVYDALRTKGFFLVRDESGLFAIASICTHRNCKLRVEADKIILCPCHGSRFNSAGHVMHGPATKDLPRFQTTVDSRGHVMVML